ncbi:unnamed protein product [Rhizoctonia solani]|uniref:Tyrosinase copper-binding domain-containing protein n=1 Tax=Rhizoctonia solani TaxID=456999 RepID=A0A8H3HU11_9AGAM|nr:unnamed protein product [Rhizoctonia solani]
MRFTTALSLSTLVALVAAAKPSQKCSSLEVRREWRTFSKAERKAWIDATNCLNKKPRTGKLQPPIDTDSYPDVGFHIAPVNESSTYYDDLVYAHMNLNPVIHKTGLFLPWHRVYLHEWTNIIRKECGYKGVVPYWAWENDSEDFLGSSIWDTDSESGLGGFSDDASDDYTLHTGALDLELAYPVPHKLRRHYIPFPFAGVNANISATSTFTPAEVQKLFRQTNFTSFQEYMEKTVGMHAAIHLMHGGDMGTVCPAGTEGTANCPRRAPTFSPNDPTFHLHHGNVDRLWWLWQEKSLFNKNAFHGGSVQNASTPNGQAPWLNKTSLVPSAGLWPTYNVGETLDTRIWPWCYVYE